MKNSSHFPLLLIVLLFLSACVTEKGASHYFNKHSDKLAEIYSSRFPVKERLVPGAPVVVRDTIPGDSVQCPPSVINPATGVATPGKIKCPDSTHETLTIVDTIYQEDPGKLEALNKKYLEEHDEKIRFEEKNKQLKQDNTVLQLACAAFGLVLIGLLIFILRK